MRWLPAPKSLDVALALGLAAWWIVEVGVPSELDAASLCLMTVPLAWRRVAPLAVMLVVGCGFVLGAAETHPAEPLAQLVAILVAPYSVAVHARSWRDSAAGAGVALAAGAAAGLLVGDDVLFILVLVSSAWGVGAVARRLLGRSVQLEERAAVLAERARSAAVSERERIARELHDVVSHSVSLMVVQAGAAEQLVRRDPDQAIQALRAAQATGRAAVDDLRRMLGLLRGPDAQTRSPQPGLGAVDDLVASFAASGMPVELERQELPSLPAGVDLAAYRIVQEALTNAAKHAPGCPTRLDVRCASGHLLILARTVSPPRHNGTPPGSGLGLVGMRERVVVYGGDLEVGRDANTDWVVRASIPLPPS